MRVSTINLDQFTHIIDSMTDLETHHAGTETIYTGTVSDQVVILMQNGPTDSATLIKLG